MFRRLIAVAVLVAPLGFAGAAQAHGMNRDHFVHRASGYYVTTQTNGREMCLEGYHPRSGERFEMHKAADGQVTGTFEGRTVSFNVDRLDRSR